MNNHTNPPNGNLVPAGRDDLVRVATANLLVSRGMADLAKIQVLPPDFDIKQTPAYQKSLRFVKLMLRVREGRQGFDQGGGKGQDGTGQAGSGDVP